jgi:hypothetical protein
MEVSCKYIYSIISRETENRGGPPAWDLDVGLTIPHRKKKNAADEELLHGDPGLDEFLGNIIRTITSMGVRWVGHIARMG